MPSPLRRWIEVSVPSVFGYMATVVVDHVPYPVSPCGGVAACLLLMNQDECGLRRVGVEKRCDVVENLAERGVCGCDSVVNDRVSVIVVAGVWPEVKSAASSL